MRASKVKFFPNCVYWYDGRDLIMLEKCNLIFTIGHSTASAQQLLSLLRKNNIQLLTDVRSTPYSKHTPQANREAIRREAQRSGIDYVFMGDYLGGKPEDIPVYDELGNFDYSQLAATDRFTEGMKRLMDAASRYRVCLLCAEEDPSHCHRGMLISRELVKNGIEVRHIRHNGKVELQEDIEKRIPPVQKGLFSEIHR
jgi:uncharacterized protein (DUF488 family)